MLKLYILIYNIIFSILFFPGIFLVLIFSLKYRKDFFYKLAERFGNYNFNKLNLKKTIWFHCASLGEVRAVEPILSQLEDEYFIVLTANTKAGVEYAKNLANVGFIALLPFDIYPFMLKAFNKISPELLILVETELWANMLYIANKKNIKTLTINGRMSKKSFRSYKKFKFFFKKFVQSINEILARTQEDADRFSYLSDDKIKISISGNIKYDRDFNSKIDKSDLGLKDEDFVFTAGSVRDGEEEIIVESYKTLRAEFEDIKFFLAPRHFAKIKKITAVLKKHNINFSLFSQNKNGFKNNFVLIDVFGKLENIYSVSDICFVGGSIVENGGQNPIEPAAYSKPVLFGKNMDSFKSEADALIRNGGAFIVENENDLSTQIKRFILNKALLISTGKNAVETVKAQKGAVSKTVVKIKEILNA